MLLCVGPPDVQPVRIWENGWVTVDAVCVAARPVVRERDAVGVAAEVVEDLSGAANGCLAYTTQAWRRS